MSFSFLLCVWIKEMKWNEKIVYNQNEIWSEAKAKKNQCKYKKNKITTTTTQSTVRNDVLFTTNRQHKQPSRLHLSKSVFTRSGAIMIIIIGMLLIESE